MPNWLSRYISFPPTLLLATTIASFAPLHAQVSGSVAVLDLEGRGISQVEAESLTDRLRTELVLTGTITVVERGQMEQILLEQDFQMTGCTSNECAVEVGQLLGVTAMLAGSIGRVGSTYSIDIRMIDVQSGRITQSLKRDYRCEIDGLLDVMTELAQELVGATTPPPPAPVEVPTTAFLSINSQPPNASILLDGVGIGNTPVDNYQMEPYRQHRLSLILPGYQQVDTLVYADAGDHLPISVSLEPQVSWLWINSTPIGARVTLHGE